MIGSSKNALEENFTEMQTLKDICSLMYKFENKNISINHLMRVCYVRKFAYVISFNPLQEPCEVGIIIQV